MIDEDRDIFREYLDILSELKSEHLDELRLDRVLFNECIYVQRFGLKETIKKYFFSLFQIDYAFSANIQGKEVLLITRIYHRNDHDSYWQSIKEQLKCKDEIVIDYLTYKKKFKSLKVGRLFKNIKIYRYFYSLLYEIKNRTHRIYLASVLMDLYNYKCTYLDTVHAPKIVMTFFDSDPFENFTIQYFAKKGSITITNQHGYPIYRPYSNDLLNQSQIVNLTSQYYLAKGVFTQKQFIAAGFSEERIKIVGSLQGKKAYKSNGKKCFAVFLDTPVLEFGIDANRKMIQLALDVSKKTNYSFIIKMHPADKRREYYKRIIKDSLGIVATLDINTENLYRKFDFAIIHASSIYIDLIMEGFKVYKVEAGYDFPLVEMEDDIIVSSEQLVEKYNRWLEKPINVRRNYIKGLQDYYSANDARKNIKRFIESVRQ